MAFNYVESFHIGGFWSKEVAKVLNGRGVRCVAPDVKIAKNNHERDEMTKFEKDIIFDWTDKCLEVKSSTREFTDDVLEYPFDSLFVDTVSGYDAKVEKPLAYVLISQKTRGIVCISPKTYDKWRKVNTFDRKREIMEWFYSAPKGVLQPFDSLVDHLVKIQNESDGW
jgi:hypothetical protein